MTAPTGAGKSVLIGKLAERLRDAMPVALMTRVPKGMHEFFAAAFRGLDIYDAPESDTYVARLGAYLADRAAIGARLTVILDDAQEMSDEIMANLAVFLEFKSVAENGIVPKGEGIVEFILVGDEELARIIHNAA